MDEIRLPFTGVADEHATLHVGLKGRDANAGPGSPTPEERVRQAVAESSTSCVVHDFLVARMMGLVRAAVAEEREENLAALAALTDPYDDSDDRYLSQGFADGVAAAEAAIRARGQS